MMRRAAGFTIPETIVACLVLATLATVTARMLGALSEQRRAVTERVIECAAGLGLHNTGTFDSPVKGRKGNREILVSFLRRGIIASS